MKAIAKTRPAPGVEIIEAVEPTLRPGTVKVKLEAASVCGTDLHIYNWDEWSASRIQTPRIIGHEFCGTIVEVASDVTQRTEGQFIASESHITCGHCQQCRNGQGHVCVNTQILGVDVDGGFAEYVVIPWENARPTSRNVPLHIACFQDALGNAVHTALDGPIKDQKILITGLGPIGAFAASICRTLGASTIAGTEISPYRQNIAAQLGLDSILDPRDPDLNERLKQIAPHGFDGVLEMSGHPSQLQLAIRSVRPGGRISLLGVYPEGEQIANFNEIVFKGVQVHGIVGRKLWETWQQMEDILALGKLNLEPVITHRMHFTQFQNAMELMKKGEAGKVVFNFSEEAPDSSDPLRQAVAPL